MKIFIFLSFFWHLTKIMLCNYVCLCELIRFSLRLCILLLRGFECTWLALHKQNTISCVFLRKFYHLQVKPFLTKSHSFQSSLISASFFNFLETKYCDLLPWFILNYCMQTMVTKLWTLHFQNMCTLIPPIKTIFLNHSVLTNLKRMCM